MKKIHSFKAMILIATGLFLSACNASQLVSKPPVAQDPDVLKNGIGRVPAGVPYFLPESQFKATLVVQLSKCEDSNKKADVQFSRAGTITESALPGLQVMIDYRMLEAWQAKSTLDLKFHDNGMIKTINADADDQTKEIATNSVTSVLNVAKIAAGPAGVLKLAKERTAQSAPGIECADDAKDALKKYLEAKKELRGANQVLKYWEREVAALRKDLDEDSNDESKELEGAIERLEEAKKDVEATKKKLEENESKITVTLKKEWRPYEYGDTADLTPSGAQRDKLGSMLTPGLGTSIIDELLHASLSMSPVAYAREDSEVAGAEGAAPAQESGGSCADAPESCVIFGEEGLLYRIPAYAHVDLRADEMPDIVTGPPLLARFTGEVPQAGSLMALPLKVGAFENKKLEASFSEKGRLTGFKIEIVDSAGENLSGLLAETTGSLLSTLQELEKADLEDAKTELELLQKQAAIQEQQEALNSPYAEITSATEKLQAEKALLDAERELVLAQAALDAARAGDEE